MERLVELQFAGDGSDACMHLAEPHLTVRLGTYYPEGMIEAGDRVMVRDLESGQRGFAWVTGIVHGVAFDDFARNTRLLRLERPGLETPAALQEALLRFYPEATAYSEWTFITFRTFMKEMT